MQVGAEIGQQARGLEIATIAESWAMLSEAGSRQRSGAGKAYLARPLYNSELDGDSAFDAEGLQVVAEQSVIGDAEIAVDAAVGLDADAEFA